VQGIREFGHKEEVRFLMGQVTRRAGIPTSVSPASALRGVIYKVVTPERMSAVIDTVCTAAEGGDLAAAKLLIDRCLGPSIAVDVQARMDSLEQLLSQRSESQHLDSGGIKDVVGTISG
jgi:hypothetical protein